MFLTILLTILTSLEADFVQTKQVAMMAEPQVATGHLSYRAPDFIRWEYRQPEALVWELNGKQSNVNPQLQGLLRMIMRSVSGENLQSGPDFEVTQNGDTYTLIPRKRDYKHMFRSIVITLDPATRVAKRVEMTEADGNRSWIEFLHVTTE